MSKLGGAKSARLADFLPKRVSPPSTEPATIDDINALFTGAKNGK